MDAPESRTPTPPESPNAVPPKPVSTGQNDQGGVAPAQATVVTLPTSQPLIVLSEPITAAPATSPAPRIEVPLLTLKPAVIQERLGRNSAKNAERFQRFKSLFREVGEKQLEEQDIPHTGLPNLICTLAGTGPSAIVVGAHYDRDQDKIDGAVDNWSGASLLPSLFESLRSHPRNHTFVFVGFAGESEKADPTGPTHFLRKLGSDARSRIKAAVFLDSLGLASPHAVNNISNPILIKHFEAIARSQGMVPSDSGLRFLEAGGTRAFNDAGIPCLLLSSRTPLNNLLVDKVRETARAINPDDYYATYRLLALYLAYLDLRLD